MADSPTPRLYVGTDGLLLAALRRELAGCTRASFAVSFVMDSGASLLEPDLRAATLRDARIRLLTTDYLDVTEPDALRRLLAIQPAIAVRVFEAAGRAFHPKAYLFERPDGSGRAFVGSANLSRSGLVDGVEWTWTVLEGDTGMPMLELGRRFDEFFDAPQAKALTEEWIRSYAARRQPRAFVESEAAAPYGNVPPTPRPVQSLALEQLAALRADGETKALVIAATGLGKTFLAAFDSRDFQRVLFIAHREELLRQAAEAFGRVRPKASIGIVIAGRRELDRTLVFASVASLRTVLVADPAALEGFDYVVVDEFHHAAAPTYVEVLGRIRPRFLLGLTATPYRGDNRDLYALCDGNVAYEIGLFAAIGFGWLVPFHYYGVADVVTYTDELLNESRSRYDETRLGAAFSTSERVALALEHFGKQPSKAALGFCVSIDHASYMADAFRNAGVPALAVHSGPGSADRADAIARLTAGELRVLFVVDLFNEGVDIPSVDLVMFLRPTESMTVFLQQLGRGLRTAEGKARLTVLDFIGNYRRAQFKLPFLVGVEDDSPESIRAALRTLEDGSGRFDSPDGIHVELQPVALDHLREAIETSSVLRTRLIDEFGLLARRLGRRPTMLELERQCRYSARQFCRTFGTWFDALRACGVLTETEAALDEDCGDFLRELERTAMTRTYKMVAIQSMLQSGAFRNSIKLDEICAFSREHFSHARFHHEIEGTPIADVASVERSTLGRYWVDNPIRAWTTSNARVPTPFFTYGDENQTFSYVGPVSRDHVAFTAAVAERAVWRLETQLMRPGPAQRLYKVLPGGPGRALIMLGEENGDGLPRGGGWRVVVINGKPMYGKFAKIALNTLSEQPDGANRLTDELSILLGGGLLDFSKPYWVLIRRPAVDSDVLEIEAPYPEAPRSDG